MIRHLLKLIWNRKRANALLMIEIFLSFLVVFGVVTTGIYFSTNARQPLGFDYQNVAMLTISYGQSSDDYWTPEQVHTFKRLLEDSSSWSETEAAAGTLIGPFKRQGKTGIWRIRNKDVELQFNEVTDDFLKVMKLQLVSGRWFGPADDGADWDPVVIDRDAAKALFGNENPVGKKFDEIDGRQSRVVGVISDFRKDGALSGRSNFVFERKKVGDLKHRPARNIVVRFRPDVSWEEFEPQMIARMRQVAPEWTFDAELLTTAHEDARKTVLMPLTIGGITAAFLLLMVGLGLLGVLWQTVTRRTRELGLRRAIGASESSIHRQIVLEVVLLTSLAVILAIVVLVQLPIAGWLSFFNPAVFTAGIVASLIIVFTLTISCSLYPSWLATRIEPADALRYE